MDTNRLKRFAVEARNILMQGVKNRLQAIGFDLKTGIPAEMPQKMEGGAVFMGDTVTTDFYSRWMSLYNNIQARGIKQVAEDMVQPLHGYPHHAEAGLHFACLDL